MAGCRVDSEGEQAMVYGEAKSGKSHFVLDIAMHLCHGLDWWVIIHPWGRQRSCMSRPKVAVGRSPLAAWRTY